MHQGKNLLARRGILDGAYRTLDGKASPWCSLWAKNCEEDQSGPRQLVSKSDLRLKGTSNNFVFIRRKGQSSKIGNIKQSIPSFENQFASHVRTDSLPWPIKEACKTDQRD